MPSNSKILSLGNTYFEIDSIHFPLGKNVELNRELVGTNYVVYAGSSALNFCRMCKSLGLTSSFIGKMGNDLTGQMVVKMLTDEGIEFSPIISNDHQTNLALNFVADNGDALMFAPGTANQSLEPHELEDKLQELLQEVDYLYLGGVFKLKRLIPALGDIINLAHTNNVKVALDHNRITNATTELERELMKRAIKEVDYYLPSKDELLDLLSVKDLDSATHKIQSLTKAVVVIKNAHEGAIGIKDGKVVKVPAYKVDVHSTVGAGDSFNAGFIKAYSENLDFKACIKFANATAALKVSQEKIPTLDDVNDLLKYE